MVAPLTHLRTRSLDSSAPVGRHPGVDSDLPCRECPPARAGGDRVMRDLPALEERAADRGDVPLERVGWLFIVLYALAFMSTSLVLIAPLLVTLALKVDALVGIRQAPDSLALVTGVGAL